MSEPESEKFDETLASTHTTLLVRLAGVKAGGVLPDTGAQILEPEPT
jgi:hypothetical protein